jgi:murein DD-endopeptidase MepM/ murein hydrolase activator NlpD
LRYILYITLLYVTLFADSKDLNLYTFGKKYKDHVDIYLVNDNFCDITVTLKAKYQNLKPLKILPITFSVKPYTTTKVIRFNKVDEKNKWKYHVEYKYRQGKLNQHHDDSYLYRLPYKIGTFHRVSQGSDTKLTHKGSSKYAIDFQMKKGTKIYAVRDGIVLFIKVDSNIGGVSKKKFFNKSNHIGIEHADGTIGLYSHLRKNGSLVKVGDRVIRGDHIGYSGNTGFTSGPHLHFGVYTNIDGETMQTLPIKFITKKGIIKKLKKDDKFYAIK